MRNKIIALAALLSCAAGAASAAEPMSCAQVRGFVSETVSPQATGILHMMAGFHSDAPFVAPKTPDDWAAANAKLEASVAPFVQPIMDHLKPVIREETLGGVSVVWVSKAGAPAGSHRVLIYLHGGGYTWFSARSSEPFAAIMADATGIPIVSVDYTTAPRGDWRKATGEVVAVYKALLAKGYDPKSIGIYGGSSGGGLAAGSVLRMRDEGLPLPGAVELMSPWSDITATGDTYTTLACADPILDLVSLKAGADVYAKAEDQKNPYVSPVYGDYAKPFPPTLIQGGTREIFLSNFVRQYQAIRSGGGEAELDLYEGMTHGFQDMFAGSPESRIAYARAADFWRRHLSEN